MRDLLLCVSVLLIAATTQPASRPSAAAGMQFIAPAGWQKVEQDGMTIYVAPDAKEGDSTAIVLFRARHLDGDLTSAFAAARKEAAGDFQPFHEGELKPSKSSVGDECLSIQQVLQDASGRRSLRTYLATRHADQFEVCMFVADTLAGFTSHAKEADAFMESLRIAPTTQPVK